MAFTLTSNYAGKAAGFYISAAMEEATSLEHMTILQNIKYKENLQTIDGDSFIRNGGCDFLSNGNLSLTDSVLEPKKLQINYQMCKDSLLAGWEAEQMKAGAWNRNAPKFDAYVLSYMAEHIADGLESSIWNGLAATQGQFAGFTAAGGAFATGGTVQTANVGGAATVYTAINIIAQLQAIAASILATVYGKEDLRIFMNWKTYRFYISAISTLGYVNAYSMNDSYIPTFEGIKLAVVYGMPDDTLVAARTSNLYFGTDLISDTTMVKLMDMSPLDGSENLRFVAKFTAGVQVGIGAETVQQD